VQTQTQFSNHRADYESVFPTTPVDMWISMQRIHETGQKSKQKTELTKNADTMRRQVEIS
jgi:hypothetical protein